MRSDYDILEHGMMLADRHRLGAYLEAIRAAVRPGDVVADIGSGTGVFALAACEAGARRVFAIEPGAVVQVAREVIADNDCASRVDVIADFSTNVELPEPVDVIVFDVRGVLPDHQVSVALDARRRFLKPGGRMVPESDVIWAAPVTAPELYDRTLEVWSDRETGIEASAIRRVVANTWRKSEVEARQLVADPQPLLSIDYGTLESEEVFGGGQWCVATSVTVHGWAVWFESVLHGDVTLSNRPGQPQLLYGQAFFAWPEATTVLPGDVLSIEIRGALEGRSYEWSSLTSIVPRSGGPDVRFAQSAVSAIPDDGLLGLTRGAPGAARVDRMILSMMAAGQDLYTIAASVQQAEPRGFPRVVDALTYVGHLSSLYG